ncbi:hypothetical protein MCEMSEM23_02726 [Rhabdaerophilaceae bacterium]
MDLLNTFLSGTSGLIVFGVLLLLAVVFIVFDGLDLASGFLLVCGAGGLLDWLRKNQRPV